MSQQNPVPNNAGSPANPISTTTSTTPIPKARRRKSPHLSIRIDNPNNRFSHLSILSAAALPPRSLYIATYMYATSDSPPWAFYLHENAQFGGTKYRNPSNRSWIANYGQASDIRMEEQLVGLYRVAVVRSLHVVDEVIREEDGRPCHLRGMTGNIWLGRTCERLKEEGLMAFGSWEGLSEEVCRFSGQHWESALKGLRPRPVEVASSCALTE